MIPTNKEIHKKLSRKQIEYILLNDKKYFKDVERFIKLHEEFVPDNLIQNVSLWVEMLISPLITIVQFIFSQKKIDIFVLITINKLVSIWLRWFEWRQLQQTIREWITIVRSIGGPFIGCNDAQYHMYVYADGMQRIHDCLLHDRIRVTKKSAKRL